MDLFFLEVCWHLQGVGDGFLCINDHEHLALIGMSLQLYSEQIVAVQYMVLNYLGET